MSTIQHGVYFALLLSAATSRVCNGSQRPNNFTNSTSSRWNADASELTSSWPSKFSKMKLTLTRLTSSSVHPEPGSESTPTDYYKDQAVINAPSGTFSIRFVKYWNKLTAPLVLSPSVSIFKTSWTANGPKSFMH